MPSQRIKIAFDPRPHQRDAHKKRKRFSVLVWHRRSGKTVFAIIELILAALKCSLPSGRFAYVAPFYGQAKSVAWDYLKRFARDIPGVVIKEGDLSIAFPNGATIRLYGADNPDSLRGLYFDGIVMDEVADMRPQMWGEIIRPALTDRKGWALFIGTPKGINLFSDIYYAALKDSEWFADLKRASETGAIDAEELERAKREMSAPQYAQEMDCDFGAAVSNSLIPLDLALSRYKKEINPHDCYYAPVVIGVDVARFGDDRSSIFPRQGLATFTPQIYRGINTMELSNHVIMSIEKYKPDAVFVDGIGIGAGVVDRLRQLGRNEIIEVTAGSKASDPKYHNLRAEMWDKMALWLKAGGCLPECDGLLADLCAPTFHYGPGDKMILESKEDMKKRGLPSPDVAESLALTFASPVVKRSEIEVYSGSGNFTNASDWDPFES